MRKRVLTLWDGKVFLALVVLMGCILAGIASYQHVYMKTPDYAVSQVIRAARDGDMETFSRHVDEGALSGQFFDALVSHTSDSTDEFFLLNIIRSPLRASFITTADLYLNWTLAGSTDNDEYQKTADNLQRTLKSAGLVVPLAGWHLDGADWSHDNTVKLYLYNDRLGATVPCTVTLEQTPPQTWMITGQGRTFLRLSYTPVFRKDRNDIASVKAVYTLRRDSDKAVLYTSPLRLSTSAEKRTHESQFLLNPLIPSQYSLIRSQTLDGMTSELHLTAITLKDGTELALADTLPEK